MLTKLATPLQQCNLKFNSNKKTGEFEGYASVFGGVDAVNDTIAKGAFRDSLERKTRVAMFVNHDARQVPVGDWVELKEDDHGLYVVGKIDLNHKDGPTVYSALDRGAMDALSIGFRIPEGGARFHEDARIIEKIDLKEISIVNFPADDAARISVVKAEIETIESLKEAELFLRDSGVFSRASAVAFVSRVKALIQSDSAAKSKNEIAKMTAQEREAASAIFNILKGV